MKSRARQEDLSPLSGNDNDGWFYKNYRVQAEPETHRFIVNHLTKHYSAASILDLGSGNGALPAQLLDAGLNVSSTSWNGRCKVGNNIYELNLDNGFTLDNVGGSKFDVITAVDIIEHVENTWAFLRSCETILAENGVVIISTPNLGSARSRLSCFFKGYSPDYSAEEIKNNRHISPIWHLCFLAMASQAGMEIKRIIPFGDYRKYSKFKRILFLIIEKFIPEHSVGSTSMYILNKSKKKLDLSADNIY